ncbi:DUF2059 domain-containing protein [Muricauda sp. 2012CJ35-5]|uniref:DUF2059 domain-containing protein n=1 Tax=Flagellimonas spongiicola TaxID=2942208 RepID=A0ABT0PQ63_9FLAO|nr:DUF2059 domain-containing protein [Allomuricauda spongiicola]MCL6273533.1 DUF2059 domain-containing protein [Allomuricauda spongiicola]
MINRIVAVIFFALLGLTTNAQDQTYEGTLQNLFEKNGSYETFQVVVVQLFDMYRQNYNDVDTETWDKLEQEFKNTSMSDLVSLLTPVYEKYLTQEDLQIMINFYDSPTGKKYAKYTPTISQESMAIGQEWGLQIGQKVLQRLEEEGF